MRNLTPLLNVDEVRPREDVSATMPNSFAAGKEIANPVSTSLGRVAQQVMVVVVDVLVRLGSELCFDQLGNTRIVAGA